MKNIVIVGGGAGGLELATHLGNKLGRKKRANVTLIDRNQTHLWNRYCMNWQQAH
ncbi:FAD-dependent pyridine nucleotide-disulfide oxidoreductase [Aggregatibacter actinomycetemcomitans NUM4039]|nr:FAD-dependent pyridine nucleotide-disulfide oxidoreductase [Aggregatibacter actinomycetemcomitans NUM4039]